LNFYITDLIQSLKKQKYIPKEISFGQDQRGGQEEKQK
jgi:hypothetical protein